MEIKYLGNGCGLLFQIQLEKIRSSETEVRWQHEEDVDECTNCKVSFTVTKRKVRTPRHSYCITKNSAGG